MNIDTITTQGVSITKNNLPPFIEIYRALIAMPSISTTEEDLNQSNEFLINLLTGWFRNPGFNIEIQPVPDTRHKFNLLASTGHGAGGLLLTGHTDAVPFDGGHWIRDPFTLTKHDNKLCGLGTTDMKGFLALILDAPRDVDVTTLKKPLYILATANEKTSMAGARYFAEATQLHPDCTIVSKPTSLQPIRAHKGHMSNAIRIQGQSGHSSDPVRGVDAIELMYDAIGCIMQLRDLLEECCHLEVSTVPYPTFNLGATHGGDASNCICACCGLYMDIRPLPGMTLNDLNGLLGEALALVSERWPGRLTVSELRPSIPDYEYPPDHKLVQMAEKLLGAQTDVVNYCTEASSIQMLCPTLVLGLDSINQAHQPDEYLEARSIRPTRELVSQVVHHFCWH